MRAAVASARFAYLELLLASLAGLILVLLPQASFWPLLLFLPVALAKLAAGIRPLPKTPFDLLMLIFVVTAGGGVWAAYNRPAALAKFWVILAGLWLFYALLAQPRTNFLRAVTWLSSCGALIAISYLLLNDWQRAALDFPLLATLAGLLQRLSSFLPQWVLPQNQIAGVLAVILPFTLAGLWSKMYSTRPGHKRKAAAYSIMVALIALAILLSSSRAAWLGLGLGAGTWGLWATAGWTSGLLQRSREFLFSGLVVLFVLPWIFVALLAPGFAAQLVFQAPGLPGGYSRLDLMESAVALIREFPITGGGLNSFAGLYSQYILQIPFFKFAYSHNFFLDLALEQGLFGLMAFSVAFFGCLFSLGMQQKAPHPIPQPDLWRGAALASLLSMAIHGLLDDALYGMRGTPFFLLPLAMAALIVRTQAVSDNFAASDSTVEAPKPSPKLNQLRMGGLAVLVLLLGFGISSRAFRSVWWSNLGALEMARQELRDFPSGEWAQAGEWDDPLLFAKHFELALAINPRNASAAYRQGLLFLRQQDFPRAVESLDRAYRLNPSHRGIRKALAYSLTWNGSFEKASLLLASITESEQELKVYSVWWKRQGRPDLAWAAEHMLKVLPKFKESVPLIETLEG